MLKKHLVVILSLLVTSGSYGQNTDRTLSSRLPSDSANKYRIKHGNKSQLPSLLVPAALIGYGIASINNHNLKNVNAEIEEEVYTEHPHKKITVDTYLQFAAAAAVFGLDAFGMQAKHNFRDRSMIYLMSNIILNAIVYPVKKYSHVLRPDGSSYTSFPSGHTAEAFASAEFMCHEYQDLSCWYGVAGYAMAAATGYLRMYNNRHWFGDVVAGAGVGIASTKIAYWLYPKIQRLFFKDKPAGTMIMPTWQSGTLGIALARQFR